MRLAVSSVSGARCSASPRSAQPLRSCNFSISLAKSLALAQRWCRRAPHTSSSDATVCS